MYESWFMLLGGSIVFGAGIVATMVVPRRWQLVSAIVMASGIVGAVVALGDLTSAYNAPAPTGLAIAFLIAGIAGGYWVAAEGLSLLARPRPAQTLEAADPPHAGHTEVLLLACAEPERYSPRAVAARHRDLIESGALDIPTSAVPFMYMSEMARYRAIGGRLGSRSAARAIASAVEHRLATDPRVERVSLAWCDPLTVQTAAVAAHHRGASRLVLVTLGADVSRDVERVRDAIEALHPSRAGMRIVSAPSIWHSDTLTARLVERTKAAALDAPLSEVGVVLVGAGEPPAWAATHPAWSERENYFAQRVRMLLAEEGLDERRVRTAWLEWQLPDVTEAVRHLAAMGCARIVVAPGMIALPTLGTSIDLEHAVRLARVGAQGTVITLTPWGEDEALVDTAVSAVQQALNDSAV